MTRALVVIDVGGTHARFAPAAIEPCGAITLGEPVTLNTAEYPGPEAAWLAYAARTPGPLPRAAAIAAAGPVIDGKVKMTNSEWLIDAAAFKAAARLESVTLINDFGAVAHAVARAPADQLVHITGPDVPLPESGTISVIGPGTGMGVAHLLCEGGTYHVQATEGGHVGFAPQDAFDDAMLADLRARHGRVPTEWINAGPGIVPIYRALGGEAEDGEHAALWTRGLSREDPLAVAAVERFCASLGATAGDYALAHGASALVLAGGLGLRLRDWLPASGFAAQFRAKPRYEAMMAAIPVKLIIHPQPGLYGAAAAFVHEHGR